MHTQTQLKRSLKGDMRSHLVTTKQNCRNDKPAKHFTVITTECSTDPAAKRFTVDTLFRMSSVLT